MDAGELVARAAEALESAAAALEVRAAVRDLVDAVAAKEGDARAETLGRALRLALAQADSLRLALGEAEAERAAWRQTFASVRRSAQALEASMHAEMDKLASVSADRDRLRADLNAARAQNAAVEEKDRDLQAARASEAALKDQVEALLAVQQDIQERMWLEAKSSETASKGSNSASFESSGEVSTRGDLSKNRVESNATNGEASGAQGIGAGVVEQKTRGWSFGLGRRKSEATRETTDDGNDSHGRVKAALALEKRLGSALEKVVEKEGALEDLKAQLEATQDAKEVQTQRTKDLEMALDAAASENQRLHMQIAADKEIITFLDERVASLERQARQAETKIDASKYDKSRVATLQTDVSLARARASKLEQELKATQKALAEAEQKFQADKRILIREVRNLRAGQNTTLPPS